MKPVLTSGLVKEADNEVFLTFSEGLKDSTLTSADFEVKVNGVKLTPTTEYAVVATGTANDKEVKITFTGVNIVGQSVSVSTIDVPTTTTDNAGTPNILKGGVLVNATK